jgi:ribosomal protein S20
MKIISIALVALAVAGASLASAAEVTRDQYKAQVEPICETNTKANEKILSDVRKEVKKGELAIAGAQFAKAATALKTAYVQIKAVPQPAADTAKLTKWLSYVNEEINYFKAGASALKAGSKNKAQTIVAKLTHTATLANNEVISFGFRYCKLEPSKFT